LKRWAASALAVVGIFVLVEALWIAKVSREGALLDYYAYDIAAVAVSRDINPYRLGAEQATQLARDRGLVARGFSGDAGVPPYIYPPLLAALLQPLTLLSHKTAALVFSGFSLAALTLLGLALSRLVGRRGVEPLVFLGLMLWGPVQTTFHAGQVSIILAFLLSLAAWAVTARRHRLAGLALGTAIVLKAFPVVLVAWLVLRRSWKVLAWTCAGAAAAVFCSSLFIDPELYWEYLIRPQGMMAVGPLLAMPPNLSASSICVTLLPPGAGLPASIGVSALIVMATFVATAKTRKESGAALVSAGAFFAMICLVNPVSWDHHQVLMATPVIILLREVRVMRSRPLAVLALFAAASVSAFSFGMLVLLMGRGFDPRILKPFGSLGIFLTWGALTWRLFTARRFPLKVEAQRPDEADGEAHTAAGRRWLSPPGPSLIERWRVPPISPLAILCGIVLFFIVAGLTGNLLVGRVPDMDEVTYALVALGELDRWTAGNRVDLEVFSWALTTRFYPPLYVDLLALTYWVLGVSTPAVLVPNLLLGSAAIMSVYGASRRMGGGPGTGLIAATLLACLPGFIHASGASSIDFAMACWAAIAFYFYVAYRTGCHYRARTPAGSLAGLAVAVSCGYMTRWTFVLFVLALMLPHALFALSLRSWTTTEGLRRHVYPWLAIAAGTVPLLVWLLFRANISQLMLASGGEDSGLSLLRSIAFYVGHIAGEGAGPVLCGAAGFVLVASGRGPWRSKWFWILVAWIAICLLAFGVIPRKKVSYIQYAMPSFCLLVAHAITKISAYQLRSLARAALLAASIGGVGMYLAVERSPQSPRFFRQVIADIERDWRGGRQVRVLVHNGAYPKPLQLTWLNFIFENAAAGTTSKTFLDYPWEPTRTPGEECQRFSVPPDYVVIPYSPKALGENQPEDLYQFRCYKLSRVGAEYDLPSLGHLEGRARLYRVAEVHRILPPPRTVRLTLR